MRLFLLLTRAFGEMEIGICEMKKSRFEAAVHLQTCMVLYLHLVDFVRVQRQIPPPHAPRGALPGARRDGEVPGPERRAAAPRYSYKEMIELLNSADEISFKTWRWAPSPLYRRLR